MRTFDLPPQCRTFFVGFTTEGYYLIDSFERHIK